MMKLKKLRRSHLETMLIGHFRNYPAIRIVASRLAGFPMEAWDADEPEFSKNIKLFVRGLKWEKPKGE